MRPSHQKRSSPRSREINPQWPPCFGATKRDIRIVAKRGRLKRRERHQGIVLRGDNQRRPSNFFEQLIGARTCVVIIRIAKAAKPRRHRFVEFAHGAHAIQTVQRIQIGIEAGLLVHAAFQPSHKSALRTENFGAARARRHKRPNPWPEQLPQCRATRPEQRLRILPPSSAPNFRPSKNLPRRLPVVRRPPKVQSRLRECLHSSPNGRALASNLPCRRNFAGLVESR